MKVRNRHYCQGPRVRPDAAERKGCGFEVTALFQRIPQDGKEYTVLCPKCGNELLARQDPFADDFDPAQDPKILPLFDLPAGLDEEDVQITLAADE